MFRQFQFVLVQTALLSLSVSVAPPVAAQEMPSVVYRATSKSESRQASQIESPPSWAVATSKPVVVPLGAISEKERIRETAKPGLLATGITRAVPLQAEQSGQTISDLSTRVPGAWVALDDTRRIWRIAIDSDGASGLRLHFKNFHIGGGQVWVYGKQRGDGALPKPYTGAGPFGDGDFWADAVDGDEAIVEYLPASSADSAQGVPFQVAELSHLWDNALAGMTPSPQAAAPCHQDVTCFPDWATVAKSVARISFVSGGSSYVCTGTLLNNTGRKAYFLTAAHCIQNEAEARSLQAYWFYQTSTCNGTPPSLSSVPSTAGAHLVTSTGFGRIGERTGDATLLELSGSMPDGVVLSGWDAASIAFGTRVAGIHHPRGDYKRISRGATARDSSAIAEVYTTAAWDAGNHIEQGSSGSGLFTENGRLVGVLSYGPDPAKNGVSSQCDIERDYGGYTRFSFFQPSIQSFLTGTETPPPPEIPEAGGELTPGETALFTVGPASGPTLYRGDFSYLLDVPADATSVRITLHTSTAGVNLDLHARYASDVALTDGRVVSDHVSANSTGEEEIVITPQSSPALRAGRYYIAMVLWTTNVKAEGSITAIIERRPPSAPQGGTLSSGRPVEFVLPRVTTPTLFTGTSAYRVDVPDSATQLDLVVEAVDPDIDVDLYVRYGEAPAVQNSRIIADRSATTDAGHEMITLTRANGLRTGTYYVTVALFTTGADADGLLMAELQTGSGSAPAGTIVLSSGQARDFDLAAVNDPSFYFQPLYAIDVPAGAESLTVDLTTTTPGVDVDLYVRYAARPDLPDGFGEVIANYVGEGLTGTEQLVVTGTSDPPLQAGRYYIGLGLYTTGQRAVGNVVATVRTAGSSAAKLTTLTHGATALAGGVAPGAIVTLWGEGIGPDSGLSPGLGTSGRVLTTSSGTTVYFDGVAAPLFYVSSRQVNAQVPYSVATRSTTQIVITRGSQQSNTLSVPVVAAAPGFFAWQDGSNRVIAIRPDGSFNSPQNASPRGEVIVLYATGEGLTDGSNQEGLPVPVSGPYPKPRGAVEVLVGGVSSRVLFAAGAPGFVGLMQLNIEVPQVAPTGSQVPIVLKIGGISSPSGLTMAVR